MSLYLTSIVLFTFGLPAGAVASSGGPYFRLVPVLPQGLAAPPYPDATAIDFDTGTITFPGGPQRVWLEIRFGGWGTFGNGTLSAWQAFAALAIEFGGDLIPAEQPCDDEQDCDDAFGVGVGGFFNPVRCNPSLGLCLPVLIDLSRYQLKQPVFDADPSCTGSDLELGCSHVLLPPVTDPGIEIYGGTLVLDAAADAKGDYAVEFLESSTFMVDSAGALIPTKLIPAVIRFPVGSCCFNLGTTEAVCLDEVTQTTCDAQPGVNRFRRDDLCPPVGPECTPACLPSSAPELQRQFDETGDSTGDSEPKNRVLPIKAGDAGQEQTIRVSWDAQPNWPGGHAALVGQEKWMTEPFQQCGGANHGLLCTPPNGGPVPGQPQKWFWVARLTCDPSLAWYGDLTELADHCTVSGEACVSDADCAAGSCGVDGAIHIFDQGIVPSKNANQQAIYSVQVIKAGCPFGDPMSFSNALVVTQPVWGDIGNGTDCPMAPPNGVADLIPDVIFALNKFSNRFCAPKKTRVDVEPAELDMVVNISDVLALLNAFAGAPYAFAAGPACSAGG